MKLSTFVYGAGGFAMAGAVDSLIRPKPTNDFMFVVLMFLFGVLMIALNIRVYWKVFKMVEEGDLVESSPNIIWFRERLTVWTPVGFTLAMIVGVIIHEAYVMSK